MIPSKISPYQILAWYILAHSIPDLIAEEKQLREEIASLKDQLMMERHFRRVASDDGDIWMAK